GLEMEFTVVVALYDARTGKLLGKLPRGVSGNRQLVIWSPDGATVYDPRGDGWNARTGKPEKSRIAKESTGLYDVTLSRDGRLALSRDYERLPNVLRETASGRVVLRIPDKPRAWEAPRAAAFALHGTDVAIAAPGAHGRLVVWRARTGAVDAWPMEDGI